MWYPRTWDEINQLVTDSIEESDVLDFKRELGTNPELAKDIAAMTVNGGVIILGIDEDKETRTAKQVTPVTLKGAEEKVRQVTGSRISPPPDVHVEQIASEDDARLGALVIEIPASPSAPHMANDRFPRRQGSITAYLPERDVERLYEQRRRLTRGTAARTRMAEFVPIPGGEPVAGPEGALKLLVRPLSPDNVGLSAWQGEHLARAGQATISRLYGRFENLAHLYSAEVFTEWRPHDAAGWASGSLPGGTASAADPPRIAAFFGYPAALSFQARFGLPVRADTGRELYKSAREPSVAIELMAMLVFAAEYFVETLGGGLLHAELSLFNFGGAKSVGRAHGRDLRFEQIPGAPHGCEADRMVSSHEILDDPEFAATALIERWLPAFCNQGDDLFRWLRDRHA